MADRAVDGTQSLVVSESLLALEPAWRTLAARQSNIFATWEWTSLWWRHFGGRRRLRLLTTSDHGGEISAIIPLYLSRSYPLRVARLLGHGPADQLGVVCDPADRVPAIAALRALSASDAVDWDVLLCECLPGREHWDEALGATAIGQTAYPLVATGTETWEQYLVHRKGKLRQELRSRQRRLTSEFRVTYRRTDDRDRLADDFGILLRLHQARWGDAGAFAGPLEAFHREFAAIAFDLGWLRLWFMELDGEPVTAALGYRYAGIDWGYQMGRDPRLSQYGVGTLLTEHLLRDAFASDVTEYRFLRGDHRYKRRFATDDPGLAMVAMGRTVFGRTALAAARVALRYRPARKLVLAATG
jgi:CelD/BcsL family acetyltransferase involved in cellulose biosynthesis